MLATENPIEQEGTFPLPEAQLDRFFLRTALGYPCEDDEVAIVEQQLQRRTRSPRCARCSRSPTCTRSAARCSDVYIDPSSGAG